MIFLLLFYLLYLNITKFNELEIKFSIDTEIKLLFNK